MEEAKWAQENKRRTTREKNKSRTEGRGIREDRSKDGLERRG